MVSIFNFADYRAYIKARFEEMPKKGYGQSLKLARMLEVHTTLVSQVISGVKTFTLEQASLAAEFFELNEIETDFFLLLVQHDRAGNPSFKRNIKRQIETAKSRAKELSNRLQSTGKLSEEQRAIFYSDWSYSAIRQMTAIPGFDSLEAMAAHFNLSRQRTKEIIDFLLAAQLCVEEKGKLRVGPASTHSDASSPWVRLHHVNWREKAIESLSRKAGADIHYTSPLTIAVEDGEKVREMIVKFLESVNRIVDPSPSEQLRCLNIDWFEVQR